MSMPTNPLAELHRQRGAEMFAHNGVELPWSFGNVYAEHEAMRAVGGIVDLAHLGMVRVEGAGGVEFLNHCLTNDLTQVPVGHSQYTLCCAEQSGGIIADLQAFRISDDEIGLFTTAANAAVLTQLLAPIAPSGLVVTDRSSALHVTGVYGSKGDQLLRQLGLPASAENQLDAGFIADLEVAIIADNYCGEPGSQLIVAQEAATTLWHYLQSVDTDIWPIGFAAYDALRLEAGRVRHGVDMTPSTTPYQVHLHRVIADKKPQFWGKRALAQERELGLGIKLVGLTGSRGADTAVPAAGTRVYLDDGVPLGYITSAAFSPALRQVIAFAMVGPQLQLGAQVTVHTGSGAEEFTLVAPPFWPPRENRLG